MIGLEATTWVWETMKKLSLELCILVLWQDAFSHFINIDWLSSDYCVCVTRLGVYEDKSGKNLALNNVRLSTLICLRNKAGSVTAVSNRRQDAHPHFLMSTLFTCSFCTSVPHRQGT